MRGVVYDGKGARVTDGLTVRSPGANEVLVRIAAAGLCHSDVSVVNGTIPWPSPSVLGHEGAGIVEEVGSAVTRVKPGDRVVVATIANCGFCPQCALGRPYLCRASLGNLSQPFELDGEPAYNFAATSSFAEVTLVRDIQAVPIPDGVPLTSAALMACGVATGAGAVFNTARVGRGDTAAVFGCGGVGLSAIQALRISGASRVVAIDIAAEKEALARQPGATDFVLSDGGPTVDAIRALFPYEPGTPVGPFGAGGVNWSFECVGDAGVLKDALDVLEWGGTCVAIGVPGPGSEITVPIAHFIHVERHLTGSRAGSSRPNHDIPHYAQLYLDGRLLLDEMVTATYPIEEFDQAVHHLELAGSARSVLVV